MMICTRIHSCVPWPPPVRSLDDGKGIWPFWIAVPGNYTGDRRRGRYTVIQSRPSYLSITLNVPCAITICNHPNCANQNEKWPMYSASESLNRYCTGSARSVTSQFMELRFLGLGLTYIVPQMARRITVCPSLVQIPRNATKIP